MDLEAQTASDRLFGEDSAGVQNIKILVGQNRGITTEQIALEINSVLDQIEDGPADFAGTLDD